MSKSTIKAVTKTAKKAAKKTTVKPASDMKYRFHTEVRLNKAIEEIKSLHTVIVDRGGKAQAALHVQRALIAMQKADAAM